MRYDLTLKELFQDTPSQLLLLLTSQQAVENLGVEFANIRRRLPDLVLRLADGRIYHLEIQSTPLRKMPWRMLEYYALLHQRYPKEVILQQVLYVGQQSPQRMTHTLTLPELQYHYALIDLRTLDCQTLLAGPSWGDALLALLCRLHDEAAVVREVLRRISQLEAKAREDALVHLLNLIGLRPNLEPLLKQEIDAMPITLNLRDNPFYREAFAEGEARGKAEGKAEGEALLLRKLLQLKFGPLPAWVQARLSHATPEQLERWAERVLTADSLAAVLGSDSP